MLIHDGALKALRILKLNSFEAYIVGGAVRDHFLGLQSQDIDIVTNAKLHEIENIFSDYKIVKYKKGHTYGVVINNMFVEISTFDGDNIYEDLMNRDFTINAIAYSLDNGFVDPFNGIEAIEDKILKSPKAFDEMIAHDPLRILRAIRFSISLDMKISEELKEALNKNAYLLEQVNKQRFTKDLNIILESSKPSVYIRDYFEVFAQIFKPLRECYNFQQHSNWHHLDVLEHTLAVLDYTKPNLVLRLTALLHDIMKPSAFTLDSNGIGHFYNHHILSKDYAIQILSKLSYSNEVINRVARLIYYHDRSMSLKKASLLKFLNKVGDKDLDLYFDLRRADITGQNPSLIYRLNDIDKIEKIINEYIKNKEPYKLANLKIDGNHLLSMGYTQERIKIILEDVLSKTISGQLANERDILIKYVTDIKKKELQ